MKQQVILSARGLTQQFRVNDGGSVLKKSAGVLKAVSGVDIDIYENETLALVGESGCGKTTLSRLLLLLNKPTTGSVLFHGQDTTGFSTDDLQRFRREVQPVFQNPYASLDPRMRVGGIVAEPLKVNSSLTRQAIATKVGEALEATGLRGEDANKFPHQFSGGQRQRIAIARAIISRPRLIILDEPVSSQDISIQAQILNLLKDLQDELGMSYLFIAHDLATVRFMSDRIAVMYLGKVVESGPCDEVFANPLHPYTQALFAAALPEHPSEKQAPPQLKGEIPSPLNPPSGCRFHTRCPKAQAVCGETVPELTEYDSNRRAACLRIDPATGLWRDAS